MKYYGSHKNNIILLAMVVSSTINYSYSFKFLAIDSSVKLMQHPKL